jgi:hypothetical protein
MIAHLFQWWYDIRFYHKHRVELHNLIAAARDLDRSCTEELARRAYEPLPLGD